ncbi:hypothetical protein ACFSCW_05660 [Sphingomonas tabacisoli]|uniref:Uncharacterized protein n=1 Tax=Sphingomonas tabacisoli TaxID=2249466 RepID=A0ABW4I1E9_9SPHN
MISAETKEKCGETFKSRLSSRLPLRAAFVTLPRAQHTKGALMLLIAIALLQAAAPVQSGTTPEPAATPAAAQDATDAAPEEPKMKRVCHKEMDPRVPTLAGMQTVCKYVPADKVKTKK